MGGLHCNFGEHRFLCAGGGGNGVGERRYNGYFYRLYRVSDYICGKIARGEDEQKQTRAGRGRKALRRERNGKQ